MEEIVFKMKYKEALKESMKILAKDEKTIFVGYDIGCGVRMYGTLNDIPDSKCLETPVAENLMADLAIGLALEGFKPVLCFQRFDFILIALDAIINHLYKIESMSQGQFKAPMIIRIVIGSKVPINAGPQHTQDFSYIFKNFTSFPIYEPHNSQEVLNVYKKAKDTKIPVIIIERKDLYETE